VNVCVCVCACGCVCVCMCMCVYEGVCVGARVHLANASQLDKVISDSKCH